jgi:anti-sigma factor RsiW
MAVTAWRRLNSARDHRWAQPRLSDYVDGELSPREHARLAAHEAQCPDCARLIATLQALLLLLSSLRSRPGAAIAVTGRTLEVVRAQIEEWS